MDLIDIVGVRFEGASVGPLVSDTHVFILLPQQRKGECLEIIFAEFPIWSTSLKTDRQRIWK